jgi:hypothetical protein
VSDFDSAVFFPAFAAAGMLFDASTVLPGHTKATEFKVGFRKPDVNPITGMQSADYEIEYQYWDAPTLAEGHAVIVDGVLYRVRSAPQVTVDAGSDGFFRCAYLTREATVCD